MDVVAISCYWYSAYLVYVLTHTQGARVVWMGDKDRIATTGFSKMSDRQVALWETGSLANVKTITIDQTSGVLMPFWTDNNILFLAGKGCVG